MLPSIESDLAGKTIEKYHIHSKLGAGRMGVVYKGRDTKLNRLVALKILPAELKIDDDAVEHFLYEAMAVSQLDHPNICTIHEILETPDEQLIIVMTYYEGESLAARLAGRREAIDVNREAWGLRGVPTTARPVRKINSEPAAEIQPSGDVAVEEEEAIEEDEDSLPDNPVISFEEAVSIASQIGEGLAAAHAEGIVHRAIKPANVMITKEGQAVILDFGVAMLAGRIKLAPHYMSPEQVKGERVDHQTDIWATGAVLYEMISGRQPFPGKEDQAVIDAILDQDPANVQNDEIRPILQKSLVKDKHQRYASAGALVKDLDAIGSEEEEEDVPAEQVETTPPIPRRTLVYGVAAAIVLVLLVILVLA
jgi:non-specific serine/threonine protein kinase